MDANNVAFTYQSEMTTKLRGQVMSNTDFLNMPETHSEATAPVHHRNSLSGLCKRQTCSVVATVCQRMWVGWQKTSTLAYKEKRLGQVIKALSRTKNVLPQPSNFSRIHYGLVLEPVSLEAQRGFQKKAWRHVKTRKPQPALMARAPRCQNSLSPWLQGPERPQLSVSGTGQVGTHRKLSTNIYSSGSQLLGRDPKLQKWTKGYM